MKIAFLFLIVVYLIFAIYFAVKNDVLLLEFFVITILFQNIILIICSRYIPSSMSTIFSLIKEGMLYLALIVMIVKKGKIKFSKKHGIIIGAIGIILLKNLFLTPASLMAAVVSLRYYIIPFLGIFIGYNLRITSNELNKFMVFFLNCALFLTVFGIFEYFLLGDKLWVNMGYAHYVNTKQGTPEYALYNGVTRNFYTWDLGGIAVRRFVSITADPLATAHLIFFAFALIVTRCINWGREKVNQYLLYMIMFFVACLMCLSKAIMIFMAIAFMAIIYYKRILPQNLIKVMAVFCGLGVGLFVINGLNSSGEATSITNHINGLVNGIKNASLFGTGLGTAGVMTKLVANSSITTTESYIGSMLQQVGYVAVLLFLTMLYSLYKKVEILWKKYKAPLALFTLSLMLGLVIEMFFSESSVSMMGTCIFFIFIGLATREELYK